MEKALVVSGDAPVRIPERAFEFAGFRRWMHSESFPEEGHISFIDGTVVVDVSMEEFFEHGQVKTEIAAVLHILVKQLKFGRFAPDGTRYSHLKTRFTTEPDGLVISHEAFRTGRVRLVSGKKGKGTELIGTPDLVIEIVSPTSVDKDTDKLMTAYYRAKIREYWLVDVRDGGVRFDIFRRMPSGYVASRKLDGWVKSPVLGKSFRLLQTTDEAGDPEYTLEVR